MPQDSVCNTFCVIMHDVPCADTYIEFTWQVGVKRHRLMMSSKLLSATVFSESRVFSVVVVFTVPFRAATASSSFMKAGMPTVDTVLCLALQTYRTLCTKQIRVL